MPREIVHRGRKIQVAVDTSIGAGKARLVAAGAAGIALLFMNGGNITLKPGYKLKVEPDR
jgi:hypothetical protein